MTNNLLSFSKSLMVLGAKLENRTYTCLEKKSGNVLHNIACSALAIIIHAL